MHIGHCLNAKYHHANQGNSIDTNCCLKMSTVIRQNAILVECHYRESHSADGTLEILLRNRLKRKSFNVGHFRFFKPVFFLNCLSFPFLKVRLHVRFNATRDSNRALFILAMFFQHLVR